MGFWFFDKIFPIMFVAVSLLMFGVFIAVGIRAIGIHRRNAASHRLCVEAVVLGKRMDTEAV